MACLGDIEQINKNIGSAPVEVIRKLHNLVFEYDSTDRKTRQRLRDFSGFTIEAESEDYIAKVTFVHENFTDADLIAFCSILCLDYVGKKTDLADRICTSFLDLSSLRRRCKEMLEEDAEEEAENAKNSKKWIETEEQLNDSQDKIESLRRKLENMETRNRKKTRVKRQNEVTSKEG